MNINEIMKSISKLSPWQISDLQSFINDLSQREDNINTLNKIFNTGHIIQVVTTSKAKNEIFLASLVSASDYYDGSNHFTRFLFKDIYEKEYGIDVPRDIKLEFTPEKPFYNFEQPLYFFFKCGEKVRSFISGVNKLVVCRQVIQYGIYDDSLIVHDEACCKTTDLSGKVEGLSNSCKKKECEMSPTQELSSNTEYKTSSDTASPQDDIATIASNIAVWLDAVDEDKLKRRVILDIKKTFNVNTDIKKVSGRNIFSISFTKIDIDRQRQDLIFFDGENSTKINYSEFGTISWCDDHAVFKMSNADGSHIIKMRFMDSDGKMMKYTEIINKGE